ncbi:3-oxoacyl-acyl-carrier-protein reductase [Aureococcus anophagefferens]|uniref:3-oxoacyl-acyl-carrier-protein reductase n=1 Tax=Aureococcus anophagefferens TaxID=44056 RepID=A0ABR1G0Y0_AURAN
MEFKAVSPRFHGKPARYDEGGDSEAAMLDDLLAGDRYSSPIRKQPSPVEGPPDDGGGSDFGSDDGADDAADASRRAAAAPRSPRPRRALEARRALAPIPGIDAQTLLRAIDDPIHGDLRDQKIVQLAKKTRNVTVALTRERDVIKKLRAHVDQLEGDKKALADELDARAHAAASRLPFAAAKQAEAARRPPGDDDDEERKKPSKRELQLAKQCADLRFKFEAARDESHGLRRALVKETGDESVVGKDGAVDEGWRGRAQTIAMLKNKIRALEDAQQNGSLLSSPTAKRAPRPPRRDVDALAQAELDRKSEARSEAMAELAQKHEALGQQLEQTRAKLDASKARNASQAQECARNKEHIRTLLDKTDGDDELVAALRAEVDALRSKLRDAQAEARRKPAPAPPPRPDAELQRLRRENARLQSQVEQQAKRVRELRKAEDEERTRLAREAQANDPATLRPGDAGW